MVIVGFVMLLGCCVVLVSVLCSVVSVVDV